jgi:toxin ParE1/3/4
MITIHWTAEARHKLASIQSYITEIDHAPLIAEQVLSRLMARVEQLRVAPRSGRAVPDYRDSQIKALLEKPYRIIYLIVNEKY